MAPRFDAAADQFTLGSSFMGLDPVTVELWLYLDVDRNAPGWVVAIMNAAATAYLALLLGSDGTTLFIAASGVFSTGVALTVGQWYHVALTKSGNTHTLYIDGVSADSLSTALTFTVGFFLIGSNGTDFVNGRIDNMRIWNAARTLGEIQTQAKQRMPTLTTSLYCWWPMLPGARTTDLSGGGHTLTEGGTLADTDAAPVAWGMVPQSRSYASPPAAVAEPPEIMHAIYR